jgi:Flp pilus assembly pilin Flp
MERIKRFFKDENGAELLEIAVYAGLFIVVAAAALGPLGTALATFFGNIRTSIGSGTISTGP